MVGWKKHTYLCLFIIPLTLQCVCNEFTFILHYLAIIVIFNQTTYNVNENAGPAQPVLVLNNTSSTDIDIVVYDTEGSATGKYYSI